MENEGQTMKVIYKYPLPSHRCILTVPWRCRILSIQSDLSGELYMWALHDPEPECFKKYEIMVLGTGQETDEPLIEMPKAGDHNPFGYIQTVIQGALVWHVFLRELFE
jgi:hypothetical protein